MYLGNVGFALALGGVAQMLAPQPKMDAGAGSQEANSPSYTFNGAVNTTAQGHPVPVGYGRLIIGSAVISAGVQVEDIAL
jgi:predicted phage tail protein